MFIIYQFIFHYITFQGRPWHYQIKEKNDEAFESGEST